MNLSAEIAWAIARLEAELPNLAIAIPGGKWDCHEKHDGLRAGIAFRSEEYWYGPIYIEIDLRGSERKVQLRLIGHQQEFGHIDEAIARIHQIGKGFSKEPTNG
jgi:hypothetical protein